MKLEVTWGKAIRIWWSILWRSLIIAIVVGIIIGFSIGFTMGLETNIANGLLFSSSPDYRIGVNFPFFYAPIKESLDIALIILAISVAINIVAQPILDVGIGNGFNRRSALRLGLTSYKS